MSTLIIYTYLQFKKRICNSGIKAIFILFFIKWLYLPTVIMYAIIIVGNNIVNANTCTCCTGG